MNEYRIFDESLPDSYIGKLDPEELDLLIEEAKTAHLELEREIDGTIWEHAPQLAPNGEPINKVWPSEFSYEPILYRDEIDQNPKFERKLRKADELSKRVGLVLAVLGSANTHKALRAAEAGRLERLAEDMI